MIAIDNIRLGALYKKNARNQVNPISEELLIAVEIIRTIATSQVKWLWLTGPDAGSSFTGGKLTFNQQVAVSEVLVES